MSLRSIIERYCLISDVVFLNYEVHVKLKFVVHYVGFAAESHHRSIWDAAAA